MNFLINPVEEEAELVFGSRTFFVPGRTVEIAYSVREKSRFPLVEELVLRFLNVVESTTLEEIAGFLDMPPNELMVAVRPLLSKGLVAQYSDDFCLTEAAKLLFKRSGTDTPMFAESESRVQRFTVDHESALPTAVPPLSEDLRMFKGDLKFLIDDLRRPPVNDFLRRVRTNFGNYYHHFTRNKYDLKKIQDEELELHKIESAIPRRPPVEIQASVYGIINRSGAVLNRVSPFDADTTKAESRNLIRAALVDAAKVPSDKYKGIDDIRFIQRCFGADFLDDQGIISVAESHNVIQWFNLIPKFYSSDNLMLNSGDQRAIGEICVPRNLKLIEAAFSRILSQREISPSYPLRIAWLRPRVESWGRSSSFLESVSAIRKLSNANGLKKGSVVFQLWENRQDWVEEKKPYLRYYWPWFDDVKYFRSSALPLKMEIVLLGDKDGIAVTHAFTHPNSPFPCPIGVCFSKNDNIGSLVSDSIEPILKSLPR
jgi:hypothetical protein